MSVFDSDSEPLMMGECWIEIESVHGYDFDYSDVIAVVDQQIDHQSQSIQRQSWYSRAAVYICEYDWTDDLSV